MSTDKEHHGVRHVLDKMQDMAGAVAGKASAAMGGAMSQPFVKNAMLSDLYAIRAGEIALERGASRPVRAIADKTIADHTMSTQLVFAALGRSDWEGEEDVTPLDELDARRQTLIDHLDAVPAADFDKMYLEQQAAAHDEARTLFSRYVSEGDDPSLRSYANAILPGLEAHARAIAGVKDKFTA
jgi:putative membrane protein